MTEFEKQIISIGETIARSLERIALALESEQAEKPAPNYQARLEEFKDFDWSSIGAEVEKSDPFGVATVIWQEKRFVRRSPENSFGAVVYFSRCTGKDEQGCNTYERLITFKPTDDIKARPISREAEGYLR